MGILGIISAVATLLFVAVGGGAAYLYATDYRLEATVQETHCERNEVDVKTKQFGIDHTVKGVPAEQCGQLRPGNFVQYRVRSQRTTLFESEGGRCIYDSDTGPFCGQPPGVL